MNHLSLKGKRDYHNIIDQDIMKKYGKYSLRIKEYQRFKADKTENRNHKANSTYLHLL